MLRCDKEDGHSDNKLLQIAASRAVQLGEKRRMMRGG